jgi:hypothetical protein
MYIIRLNTQQQQYNTCTEETQLYSDTVVLVTCTFACGESVPVVNENRNGVAALLNHTTDLTHMCIYNIDLQQVSLPLLLLLLLLPLVISF